jgi:8-oxo-dGTP diphosphatase
MVNSKNSLTVVAAALPNSEGRVLLQQRPEGTAMAGLWEFPGGKVEPGESPEEALVRELHEELGIVVKAENLVPITFATVNTGDKALILLLYGCREWRGEPAPLHATALRWEHPDAMAALPMPPADYPMIGLLQAWLGMGEAPLR